MIRLLFVSGLYSYKALFRWMTFEAYLIRKIAYPLVQLTFFTLIGVFGGARPIAFYLIGNCVAVAFRPMLSTATAISDERAGGTLPYLIASPASRALLFFGRASFQVIDGVFDVLIAFVFATLVFGLRLPESAWLGMLLAILAASAAATGLGFFLGAAAYVLSDVAFLGNVAMFGLLLLTGANVVPDDLPGALRSVSEILPLTHSIAAARLYAAGADVSAGLPLLLAELALGAIWGLGGFTLLRALEFQARVRGTLEGI